MPLLLAALALVGRPGRRELGLAALFAASLAASYGAPPLPWLLSHMPVLHLAAGQRFVLVAQWAACALAACGLEALPGIPRRRLAWAGGLGGAVLLTLASLHPALRLPAGDAGSGLVARDVLAAAGAATLAFIAVALAAAGRRGIAFGLVLAETCASGLLLADGFNPTVPQAALPGPKAVTMRLETERAHGRVVPLGWVLRPNSGTLAGVPTVTGLDDVRPQRLVAYTAAADLACPASAAPERIGGNALIRRAAATLLVADRPIAGSGVAALQGFPVAGMWAARVSGSHPFAAWYPRALPANTGAEALERLTASPRHDDGVVVVEDAALPLPNSPGSFRQLAHERAAPTTIAVRCNEDSAGVVVVRESADTGWHVTVDVRPHEVVVVDGLFLGAPVGPGRHALVFSYRPAELTLGLVLAGLGGFALLSTGAVLLRRKRAADVSFGRETPFKDRARR